MKQKPLTVVLEGPAAVAIGRALRSEAGRTALVQFYCLGPGEKLAGALFQAKADVKITIPVEGP